MFALLNYMGLGPAVEDLELEVVARRARRPRSDTPLLFVHGAYAGAWCWDEHFLPYFAQRGYHAYAVSLRGHGNSAGRERLHAFGLADYVHDVARIAAGFDQPPVLIGHSMGGMVVQKYLEQHAAPAAVLMASVPPTGLAGSAFRLIATDPMLLARMSMIQGGRASPAELQTARRAVFSDDVPEADLLRYARLFQGESQRALWDMTVANLPRQWRMQVPPLLVLGADNDSLFTPAMVQATARAYGAEAEIFADMAHGMMLERNWQPLADRIIGWLGERGV